MTAALIFCFTPVTVFTILHMRNVFPATRTNVGLRILTTVVMFWNSLFNPLLYCYRDRRFKNAIAELLRLKKPSTIQSTVGTAQYVKRKEHLGSSKHHNLKNCKQHLTRPASCNALVALDSKLGTSTEVMLRRSFSCCFYIQSVFFFLITHLFQLNPPFLFLNFIFFTLFLYKISLFY